MCRSAECGDPTPIVLSALTSLCAHRHHEEPYRAMAHQQTVVFIDDLDGSEAARTVAFSLDGQQYEIDLSTRNLERLRDALAPYAARARRLRPESSAGQRARDGVGTHGDGWRPAVAPPTPPTRPAPARQPAAATASTADHAAASSSRPGSARTGPVRTGPVRTDPVRTGPVRTGPARTGPGRTGGTVARPAPDPSPGAGRTSTHDTGTPAGTGAGGSGSQGAGAPDRGPGGTPVPPARPPVPAAVFSEPAKPVAACRPAASKPHPAAVFSPAT